jgi:hypothetical protein
LVTKTVVGILVGSGVALLGFIAYAIKRVLLG